MSVSVSYHIETIDSSSSPDFELAYDALAREFAPRGELERREVIERWLDVPHVEPRPESGLNLNRTYHLLVARDEKGTFAGVRDCHVVIDRKSSIATVYLAHVLVMPPYRRTGLGALLRLEPIGIAQRVIAFAGLDVNKIDILLAAEMEHPSVEDEASIIRLIAYAKDGFAAIAPSILPYYQPDFRELGESDEPRPIPLVAVVRFLGHPDARSLPARLARAFVTHLYAVFATHVPRDHLAALEARTLGVLDAFTKNNDNAEVPLLPLPRTLDDHSHLAELQ